MPYQDFPNGSHDRRRALRRRSASTTSSSASASPSASPLGIERPATFTPPAGQTLIGPLQGNTGGTLTTSATIVVRNEGDFSILPETDAQGNRCTRCRSRRPRLEAREDFLEWFAAILQVYYQNDGNQTILVKAPDGTSMRKFNHPNQLGFNLTLQARY